MANLKYRITMTPEVRTNSEIKGAPLTNIEVDSNFKLLDTAISDVRDELISDVADVISGVGDASLIGSGTITSTKLANSGVTAGTVGSETQIPVVTFNEKGQATGYSTVNPQTEWANVLSKPANITDLAALTSVDNLETIANLSSIAALTSINGLTTAADKMIYTTAANAYATTDLTDFGRTIVGSNSAEEVRGHLGTSNASLLTSGSVSVDRLPSGVCVKTTFVETTRTVTPATTNLYVLPLTIFSMNVPYVAGTKYLIDVNDSWAISGTGDPNTTLVEATLYFGAVDGYGGVEVIIGSRLMKADPTLPNSLQRLRFFAQRPFSAGLTTIGGVPHLSMRIELRATGSAGNVMYNPTPYSTISASVQEIRN